MFDVLNSGYSGSDCIFPPTKSLLDFDGFSRSGRHMREKIKLARFSLTTVPTSNLFRFFEICEELHLQVSERSR